MEPALPILDLIPDIKAKLAALNTVVLQAPPGAGKSTVLPLHLLNEPWLAGKKILMLEPRRLAARAVANRMSSMLNEETGETAVKRGDNDLGVIRIHGRSKYRCFRRIGVQY